MTGSLLRAAALVLTLAAVATPPVLAQVGKTVETPEATVKGATYLTSAETASPSPSPNSTSASCPR